MDKKQILMELSQLSGISAQDQVRANELRAMLKDLEIEDSIPIGFADIPALANELNPPRHPEGFK